MARTSNANKLPHLLIGFEKSVGFTLLIVMPRSLEIDKIKKGHGGLLPITMPR
jgi:hypothetical protein